MTADPERALARAAAVAARLERAARIDFTAEEHEPAPNHRRCAEAVDGKHSAPDWRNRCAYCSAPLAPAPRLTLTPTRRDPNTPVIDATTLEPASWPYPDTP